MGLEKKSVPSLPPSFAPFHPGFNPYWGQTLCFRVLVPELALLRFVVMDYNWKSRNDFVGQYTLPWTCVQQGEPVLSPLAKPPNSGCRPNAVHLCLSRLPPHTPALQGWHQPPPSFYLRAHLHAGRAEGG